MVFTIVAIIFLPLSFVSQIFALDVAEYPHASGNVQYKARWIFPIICESKLLSINRTSVANRSVGISAAVSIPLIAVAFNVSEVIIRPYRRFISTKGPVRDSLPPSEQSLPRQPTYLSEMADAKTPPKGLWNNWSAWITNDDRQETEEKQALSLYRRLRRKESYGSRQPV